MHISWRGQHVASKLNSVTGKKKRRHFFLICLWVLVALSLRQSSITPATGFRSTQRSRKTAIALVVMGQAKFFPSWFQVLGNAPNPIEVSLLYGSYDKTVHMSALLSNYTMPPRDCQELAGWYDYHVNGTTWTQARNFLAGRVLALERQLDKEFDFWVFADDDIQLKCPIEESMNEHEKHRVCWQRFLSFLARHTDLPKEISTVTAPQWKQHDILRNGKMKGVSTADAMLAAFPRKRVPYLIPYGLPKEGASEWTSQAILFCIIKFCFPSSILLMPEVLLNNPKHRDYQRKKFSKKQTLASIRHSYGKYLPEVASFCEKRGDSMGQQLLDPVGPFTEATAFDEVVGQKSRIEQCQPLQSRFEIWAEQVITNSS